MQETATNPYAHEFEIGDPSNAARWKIIRAVNVEMLRRPRTPKPPTLLGMKQIQQAVSRARRRALVDDATLIAAGYNPRRNGR